MTDFQFWKEFKQKNAKAAQEFLKDRAADVIAQGKDHEDAYHDIMHDESFMAEWMRENTEWQKLVMYYGLEFENEEQVSQLYNGILRSGKSECPREVFKHLVDQRLIQEFHSLIEDVEYLCNEAYNDHQAALKWQHEAGEYA